MSTFNISTALFYPEDCWIIQIVKNILVSVHSMDLNQFSYSYCGGEHHLLPKAHQQTEPTDLLKPFLLIQWLNACISKSQSTYSKSTLLEMPLCGIKG